MAPWDNIHPSEWAGDIKGWFDVAGKRGAQKLGGGGGYDPSSDPNLGLVAKGWLRTDEGKKYLQDPEGYKADQAYAAAQAQAQAGTTSNQQMNPLAMNMFYSTAIAPMMQGLANQFHTWDTQFLDMAK